ncbi:MAG: hypothetical protein HC843_07240 [Sphingomonadales bacterium]|nr:hypothetical protein [Sphingomonadales bacterium]
MIFRLSAALFFFVALSSAAQAMDAHSFYTKGRALEKKGMAAVFSSEFKPLMTEMKMAGKTVKAENEKAKADGKPLYCTNGKEAMTPKILLAEFGKIPDDRRPKITVTQALREILSRRYPC